jgi:hypothetical protein
MLKLVVHTAASRLLMVHILPLTANINARPFSTHTHTNTLTQNLITPLRGSTVGHYTMVLNFSLHIYVSRCEDIWYVCCVLPLVNWMDRWSAL